MPAGICTVFFSYMEKFVHLFSLPLHRLKSMYIDYRIHYIPHTYQRTDSSLLLQYLTYYFVITTCV